MFRATKSMKSSEIDRLVQRAGGRHNAFTGFDATAYHITLPSEQVEVALRIEAERMVNCMLNGDDLRREKGVVLSELQGRRNDPERDPGGGHARHRLPGAPIPHAHHRLAGGRRDDTPGGGAAVLLDLLPTRQYRPRRGGGLRDRPPPVSRPEALRSAARGGHSPNRHSPRSRRSAESGACSSRSPGPSELCSSPTTFRRQVPRIFRPCRSWRPFSPRGRARGCLAPWWTPRWWPPRPASWRAGWIPAG